MKHRAIIPLGARRALGAALAAMAVVTATRAALSAEPDKALAIDAQCPWGRLSDGRGKLVRCLTQDEAVHLRDAAAAPPPQGHPAVGADVPRSPSPVAAEAAKAPSGLAGSEPPKPSAASDAPRAIWPLPAPSTKPPPMEAVPTPSPAPGAPTESSLTAEIGPVVADAGALSDAQRSLRKVRERLVECADKNGGITADRADVELRFLVQERGRAEGVSLKKRRGMSDAAAKCIADVVDRRFVGYPEEPAVGATLVVTITKKKK